MEAQDFRLNENGRAKLTDRKFALPEWVKNKGAVFDGPDNCYRYKLWRIWDEEKPKLLFVMMNPSCAVMDYDDASVAKCRRYAVDWGYGSLYIGNTFAYRATYQQDLLRAHDPIGPKNFQSVLEMAKMPNTTVVMAYGRPKLPDLADVGRTLSLYLARNGVELHALKLLKDGVPGHPLYVRSDEKLKPFTEFLVNEKVALD